MRRSVLLVLALAAAALLAGCGRSNEALIPADRATAMHETLLGKIRDRIAKLPEGERPVVDVYGESFGAWTSQDAFKGEGVDAIEAAGISHAMYTGTPKDSTFRQEVESDPRAMHVRSGVHAQELAEAGDPEPGPVQREP